MSSIGWSKEAARRTAKEQNPDLRDFYCITSRLSAHITSHTWMNLVVANGLALDGPVGLPSVTPVKIAWLQREQRYRMLPAYSRDGILLARVLGIYR